MPRDAALFEEANGSPLEGYILLKAEGGNIPPRWITNARHSRRSRQAKIAKHLKSGGWQHLVTVREWETSYQKECFYRGIRILLELERNGQSAR